MASIGFTDNVRDLSNTNGYQFEFVCERCGNGYRSAYRADTVARGTSLLRSAGSLFGGRVTNLSDAANQWAMNRSTNSAAKDRALEDAVEEIGPRFEQCRGCGDWVCSEVCWNAAVGQCTRCSPVAAEQLARFQAEERDRQLRERLTTTDLTSSIDVAAPAVVRCPGCGAQPGPGKFCSGCGTALAATTACHECGHTNPSDARFCAECGARQMG